MSAASAEVAEIGARLARLATGPDAAEALATLEGLMSAVIIARSASEDRAEALVSRTAAGIRHAVRQHFSARVTRLRPNPETRR